MNYSRNPDDYMHKLAHIQAYIFEKSSIDGVPSYYFIKNYMYSELVTNYDQLILLPEEEIYLPIKMITKKYGKSYDSNIMHWVGYIYRVISYLYDIRSSELFKKISPKYLISIYPLYHSQDAVKAATWLHDNFFVAEDRIERIMRILRTSK